MNLRSRWVGLLRIAGATGIIACHVGFFSSFVGHLTVEVFFVLAGASMVRAVERNDAARSYVWSRMKRLGPEVAFVWGLCLFLVLFGPARRGLILFLLSAPVFLENFIAPYFTSGTGIDWTFLLALWFVAALVQLQVVVYLSRHLLLRHRATTVFWSALALGFIWRLGFAAALGSLPRNAGHEYADAIYRMPLTHVESILFGFLLGRGMLEKAGQYQAAIWLFVLTAGGANLAWGGGGFAARTLGFPVFLSFNYQYLWGYPVLALAAVSLCATNGLLARAVNRPKVPDSVERAIWVLAPLTYAVYVFHGIAISVIELILPDRTMPFHSSLVVVAATLFSFTLAWAFRRLVDPPKVTPVPSATGRAPVWRSQGHGHPATQEMVGK